MTVGELVYQQAIDAGHIPNSTTLKGFISPITTMMEKMESYQQAFEKMTIPLAHTKRVCDSVKAQGEALSKIKVPKLPPIPSHFYGTDEEMSFPSFRNVQDVRVINSEELPSTPTRQENKLVAVSYKLPQNATWESLDIKFIDGHFVKVSYPNMKSQKFDYKDMGFVNMKTTKPDLKWELFKAIAENGGALINSNWDRKFGRNVKYELNEGLKKFFDMDTPPIPHYNKKRGYEPLFSLRNDS